MGAKRKMVRRGVRSPARDTPRVIRILKMAVARHATAACVRTGEAGEANIALIEQLLWREAKQEKEAGRFFSAYALAAYTALSERHGAYPSRTLSDEVVLGGPSVARRVVEIACGRTPSPRLTTIRGFAALLGGRIRSEEKAVEIARKIEAGCYEKCIEACRMSDYNYKRTWLGHFGKTYTARCGELYSHLKDGGVVAKAHWGGKSRLLDRLMAGELEARELGGLEAKEMCVEALQKVRAEIASKQPRIPDAKKKKIKEGIYRCPTCRTYNTSHETIQQRALDEAPRIRVTCDEPGCKQRPWNG